MFRKQLKHGGEGVEVGSDVEIKWAAHLLNLNMNGIIAALTLKTSEIKGENVNIPLNIDQALGRSHTSSIQGSELLNKIARDYLMFSVSNKKAFNGEKWI